MNQEEIYKTLYDEYWTSLQKNVTISSKEVAELLYDFMKKTESLKQFCDIKKIKYRENTKQYYVYVNRKQYTGKTKKELIDKLYSAFAKQAYTLRNAYTDWMLWRRDIKTNPKTLLENTNEWKKFLEHSALADMILTDINVKVLEDFYYDITKDFAIDSKRLTNINSVLNGIFKRCVSMQSIPHNPLKDVDMSVFHKRCMPKQSNKDNYTLEERNAIIKYLESKDDIYSLAVHLSMYLCVRIGELLAIRPEDIQGNTLSLKRSMRKFQTMNDDLTFSSEQITNEARIKRNKESGFRDIPLTAKARAVIDKILTLYPDNEYLFMLNGKQLRCDSFNRRLKQTCETLGIRYRSSHQIRFTVATMLYQNGVPITQLSFLLGHSDTNTTWHYIRQIKPDNDTILTMTSVLDDM